MASELEVGTVKGSTAELNGADYHLKLQDGAGNPWYLRAPDDSFRIHRNVSGDALSIDSAGAVTVGSTILSTIGVDTVYSPTTTSITNGLRIYNTSTTDNSFSSLTFSNRSSSTAHSAISCITPSGNNTEMAFQLEVANASVEKMRLTSAGLAVTGIAFSGQTGTAATGAATTSSTLDHYEEGTWTPNVGGDATYTGTRYGSYTRIGRLVTATFDMTINVIGTGSTNIVSGLPFATTDSIGAGGGVSYYSTLALSPVSFAPTVAGSTVQIRSATSASTSASNHAILGNGSRISCIVTYTA